MGVLNRLNRLAPSLAGSEHDLESGAAVDGDEFLALELNLWWLRFECPEVIDCRATPLLGTDYADY
jgi:hypothetical protein